MSRKSVAASDPLIVALDFPSVEGILSFLERVGEGIRWVKLGLEAFTRGGPSLVREIKAMGYSVFLDLKLHDIPNTVRGALQGLLDLEVDMVSLHCLGGKRMLKEAVGVLREGGGKAPLLVGVTVLTSLERDDLREMGIPASPRDQSLLLSLLALRCGLDGVVCSAEEVEDIRARTGRDFLLVVPGIRWEEMDKGDQARTSTPGEAVRKGADFLVVGRPITRSPEPLAVVERIRREVEEARGKGQ
jgi:orotidine-5'-phosphate decarboxylase